MAKFCRILIFLGRKSMALVDWLIDSPKSVNYIMSATLMVVMLVMSVRLLIQGW